MSTSLEGGVGGSQNVRTYVGDNERHRRRVIVLTETATSTGDAVTIFWRERRELLTAAIEHAATACTCLGTCQSYTNLRHVKKKTDHMHTTKCQLSLCLTKITELAIE